jgi:hypothetical protein
MASRIVPNLASDQLSIAGLDDLRSHIEELLSEPETPLNAKLFDDVELQLTGETLIPRRHIQSSPWLQVILELLS